MKRLVLLFALASCGPKSLSGMYCEGGVVDGKAQGGDCVSFSSNKADSDPSTIGSAQFQSRFTKSYALRRVSKGRYALFLDGATAGSIEEDGHWIKVRFVDDSHTYSLRNDAAGPFI